MAEDLARSISEQVKELEVAQLRRPVYAVYYDGTTGKFTTGVEWSVQGFSIPVQGHTFLSVHNQLLTQGFRVLSDAEELPFVRIHQRIQNNIRKPVAYYYRLSDGP